MDSNASQEPQQLYHSDYLQQIRELELAQARPIRELSLAATEQDAAAAKARLQDLEQRIAALRVQLRSVDAAPVP